MAFAQERGPTPTSPDQIRQAIDKLGDFDYPTRMAAGRTVRRAPAAQTVPALLQAVNEHADGFIRFRALALLTGFNDPRTLDVMEAAMTSPNDRLREVAFAYFEQNPRPAMAAKMLAALEKEEGEFVRPALVRALAAIHKEPGVAAVLIRDARRGVDFFRSTVIEAIGDYRIAAAAPTLIEISKLEGPLQDDAAIALGKIGDKNCARRARRDATVGAEGNAAGGGGGDLPAGHELLGAHRLSRENADLRGNLSWLPGSAEGRGRGPRPHRAPGQRRPRSASCSTSASPRRIPCAPR